jgi:exodeoxyribonuclease VII large subunit
MNNLNRVIHPDVIILARGGGSLEDLWAFNDEKVAYTIANSEAPVVTGIGHETDFTIADFVADIRAPTPTAAAELVTPNKKELHESVFELKSRLFTYANMLLQNYRNELSSIDSQLTYVSPILRVRIYRQVVDERSRLLSSIMLHRIELDKIILEGSRQKLSAINPQSILDRGYAIVTNIVGDLIQSVNQVQVDDELKIEVSDGRFMAKVSLTHGTR